MEQNGRHYDGWYNGNVDLMMKNGTYADYRWKLEKRVQNGFYGMNGVSMLQVWDTKWDTIPDEEKYALRKVVVEDSTAKPKQVVTKAGIRTIYRAEASNNNNADRSRKAIKKVEEARKKPTKGALTEEGNPLKMSQGRPSKSSSASE